MIVISGITNCIYQKGLNGTYEPVAELSPADMVRYVKRGDNTVWLEYLVGQWQIKPANEKGKVNSNGLRLSWAFITASKAPPENCGSEWNVADNGSKWNKCPGVSVLTAASEAERQRKVAEAAEA